MFTINFESLSKETNEPQPKLVNTIVLSLSSLLGYGIYESRRQVQKLMAHGDFRRYEDGKITRKECLEQLAVKGNVANSDLDVLLHSVVDECSIDGALLELALECSENIFGLLDLPFPELNYIKQLDPKTRKIIESLELVAVEDIESSWIVISRDPEAASIHRSMGIISIPYSKVQIKTIPEYLRTLNPQFCYQAGLAALNRCFKKYNLKSIIEMDLPSNLDKSTDIGLVEEYFNPTLVSIYYPEISLPKFESRLVEMIKSGPFGYFGTELNRLPADIDTMSLNIAVLYEKGSINYDQALNSMNWVLSNYDDNKILQVYFDNDRPRVDHVVLCNVVYACYVLGLESHPIAVVNEKLIHNFFLADGYLFGTKYYHIPETFLFHFGRILAKFSDRIPNYSTLRQYFTRVMLSRVGKLSTPLDIAKRLIISHTLEIPNYADGPQLLNLQNQDGSWHFSDLYLLPTTKGRVYNPTVDMCFCLKAIKLTYLL